MNDRCRCPAPVHKSTCPQRAVWRCKQTGVQVCEGCMAHYPRNRVWEPIPQEEAATR